MNNWATMAAFATAVARMSLRQDAPGGDIIMDVDMGGIPITIKIRPHVYEMIACGQVIAETENKC